MAWRHQNESLLWQPCTHSFCVLWADYGVRALFHTYQVDNKLPASEPAGDQNKPRSDSCRRSSCRLVDKATSSDDDYGPPFVDEDYGPPCTGIETLDAGGVSWSTASAYPHKKNGTVVLWYGGEIFEGIGDGFRWQGRSLIDRSGEVIQTRAAKVIEPRKSKRSPRKWSRATGRSSDSAHGADEAPPVAFVSADYGQPRAGLEVLDGDNTTWRPAEAYRHRGDGSIVLCHRGEYTGIGAGLRWCGSLLVDRDGKVFQTRRTKQENTTVFIDSDYTVFGRRLDVLGINGKTWPTATLYTLKTDGSVVLWYDESTCEGIGQNYRWSNGRLVGGDGELIATRWGRLPAPTLPTRPERAAEAIAHRGPPVHQTGPVGAHGPAGVSTEPTDVFVSRDHRFVRCAQVLDIDGNTWRAVSLFVHKEKKNIVLWFGEEEFEGLGKGYRWRNDQLMDGDGDVIRTKVLPDTPAVVYLPFAEALQFARGLFLKDKEASKPSSKIKRQWVVILVSSTHLPLRPIGRSRKRQMSKQIELLCVPHATYTYVTYT